MLWLLKRQEPSGLGHLGANIAEIDSPCPWALRLAGLGPKEPRFLSVGTALTSACAGIKNLDGEAVKAWEKRGLSPVEVIYLSNALAIPCLLRAFSAVTESYGKLRLSEGPLWYLGRFAAGVACVLELPLRFCWGEQRAEVKIATL